MKKSTVSLTCLVVLLLTFGPACHKRDSKYVRTKSQAKVYFKTVKIIQKGYIWDSAYGDFDLYATDGVKQVSRDLIGIKYVSVLGQEKIKGENYLEMIITYNNGRLVMGYMPMHSNRGWDCLELETKEGKETIPLYNVERVVVN